jgi:VWFA-related protein
VRILPLLSAALLVAGLSAQPRFKAGVDVVEADAVVVDASGRPVRDLTAADFKLTVDGKPRPIESVDYVDASGGSASTAAETPTGKATPPQRSAERHIVFVVDEGNITAGGGKAAIAATSRMLDRLGRADRAALLSIPSGPAVDFTFDRAAIRGALDRAIGRAARPMSADDFSLSLQEVFAFDTSATADERMLQQTVSLRECPTSMPAGRREACESSLHDDALGRLQSYRERSRATLTGLDKLFRALSTMQGPKIVVLISEGLLLRPDLRDSSGVSQLAKTAALSRVTLYSVLLEGALTDAGEGLGRERAGTRSATSAMDRTIEEQGLTSLTAESGGLLFRAAAAPDETFRRLADVLAGYYLVTFQVTPADGEGPHQIKLQATRPGVVVHARAQFAMNKAAPARTTSNRAGGEASSVSPSRRADAASTFNIDKSTVQLATRSIADANGTIRILVSLDVRDPAAHATSALALGYKLKLGDRIIADTGRVVPVQREPDGTTQPISYIAFQGLAPGTYELQLSASDGSKHSAFVRHLVSARLHAVGGYTLSDLLIAASASTPAGPFPVPAQLVARDQMVMGIEVTAGDRAALAIATLRFAVVSSANRDVLASQDISLLPDGPLTQFVRAALNLATASPGAFFAQVSIVADGKIVGVVDAPFQIVR